MSSTDVINRCHQQMSSTDVHEAKCLMALSIPPMYVCDAFADEQNAFPFKLATLSRHAATASV
jgi:hypothetical protein